MMRLAMIFGSLALGLLACSPDGDRIAAAKDQVREVLIDGESARFEDVVYRPKTVMGETVPEDAVCGWVNAKNRMGAYTGFERFVVKADVPMFQPDGDSESWSNAWADCVIWSRNKEAVARDARQRDRAIAELEASLAE